MLPRSRPGPTPILAEDRRTVVQRRPLLTNRWRRVLDFSSRPSAVSTVGRPGRHGMWGRVGAVSPRFVRLVHLPKGHNSEQCRIAITHAISDLPDQVRLTLTWDQ